MTNIYSETKGAGPNIVLLHGWGFHSGIFQALAESLQKKFRVTLIDLPGFGRSSALPETYRLENIVPMLLPLLPEKSIYLGWSMGGLIAMYLAYYYPTRLSALVVLASSPCFLATENWPGMHSEVLEKFGNELLTDYEKTLKRFLYLQNPPSFRQRKNRQWLQQEIFRYGKPSSLALQGGLEILKTTDLRHQVAALHCPQYYILGRLDTLVPSAVYPALKALVPKAMGTVISDTAHMPFLTHLKKVVELLESVDISLDCDRNH